MIAPPPPVLSPDSILQLPSFRYAFVRGEGGGKGGQCVELTTLPPSCADCPEIWEPQPPGTLRASPGL